MIALGNKNRTTEGNMMKLPVLVAGYWPVEHGGIAQWWLYGTGCAGGIYFGGLSWGPNLDPQILVVLSFLWWLVVILVYKPTLLLK